LNLKAEKILIISRELNIEKEGEGPSSKSKG
jgi:hypothetical protein